MKKKRQIYTTFKAIILGINTTTYGRNVPRESKYRAKLERERERENKTATNPASWLTLKDG